MYLFATLRDVRGILIALFLVTLGAFFARVRIAHLVGPRLSNSGPEDTTVDQRSTGPPGAVDGSLGPLHERFSRGEQERTSCLDD